APSCSTARRAPAIVRHGTGRNRAFTSRTIALSVGAWSSITRTGFAATCAQYRPRDRTGGDRRARYPAAPRAGVKNAAVGGIPGAQPGGGGGGLHSAVVTSPMEK